KLTKDKMDKGLESESEGDEQLEKVTIPKKGKGSKAEKPYPTCNTRSSPKPMYEGSIKATRQKVQDMLGIPMGSKKLEDLEQRPSKDPFIKEWENQFKHVKKPTPAAIASVISDSTQVDNGGRVSTKLLKGITEDVDISEIDWCGYIL
ncbi:hypothetical protein Tco_0426757, partial [Tanacetum coccineum]